MPRVKGGIVTRRRHKKRLEMAKGYTGAKSKLFRTATEASGGAQLLRNCQCACRVLSTNGKQL